MLIPVEHLIKIFLFLIRDEIMLLNRTKYCKRLVYMLSINSDHQQATTINIVVTSRSAFGFDRRNAGY
jgi:hypothetical protein